MKEAFLLFLLIIPSTRIQCDVAPTKINCDSPQYLELGKTGTISCTFHDDFFAVLWYTAIDFDDGTPSLRYQNHVKTGPGYESGEFDVHPNGSLIITEVLLRHEYTFTVAYIQSETDFLDFFDVHVIVVVQPSVPFPVIDHCEHVSSNCYTEVSVGAIQCSVHGVRPNISLLLRTRTVDGDRNISNDMAIIPEGVGYTTRVTTSDVFRYSPLLVLLVCKASSVPGILETNESMILVLNSDMVITEVKPKHVNFLRSGEMELNCTNKEIAFVVWKKGSLQNYTKHELLLYTLLIGNGFTETLADEVILRDNVSLVIKSVKVKHEGMYFCYYGDGLSDGVTVYNVTVSVPAYPLIEGCNQQQYCVLEAKYEGTQTCRVKGIRPRVQLRWKTFLSEEDTDLISFTNHQVTVTENGDTFDITLVSQYRVTDESHKKITVECRVVASEQELLGLTMKMDLLFVKGNVHPTDPTSSSLPWVIPVIVVVCLVLVVCGLIIQRYFRKQKTLTTEVGNKEEMISMFEENHSEVDRFTEIKEQFLKQLREKYKDLYNAVQPIPYIKDRLYCVDRVFVEGGIEYLDSRRGEMKEQWVSLTSYQNVFEDFKVGSTRCILEGEPGYGKSTVTLQFAYDWCNSISGSALRDVDILILLRLRQLGGVPSIYRAIKQFILPKDSRLSENDIENVLLHSHSVVIILDGFDEYPDQDSTTSDVISIIARQMFQESEVVLTTRSSFLPQKYPPLTKRLRLTGFDDNARRYYIRKAVVGDNDEIIERIEGYLEENPILRDLCQVPLLFVIFAHMTYESEQFRRLNSVTSFFRYMISCFHSHMRNKMNEENVRRYELFETDHGDLDKVAFEAFSGDSQRIVWSKDELCQQLGQEFYDQYVRIGILVEEEVIDIIDDPGTPITEHIQYKTEVRFYHKLFCEWYAAHYLSDYIQQNPNLDLSEYLRHLDPFDVQYLYRFSCGLNSNSSEKIIDYLKNIEGGDKFAILCILEQTGKIDNIKETIRQLCSEGVIISGHDSLLLQRSSMQLLEIAARNDIPIKYVSLHNCFQSVDLSTSAIRTTSGLALTSRIPVKELYVILHNREMTEDEYIDILQFSSMCPSLLYLRFWGSAPPKSFKVGPALSSLCSRNVTVKYRGVLKKSPKHILNLLTGRWEREADGLEATEEDFDRMNLDWAEVQEWTDEDHKRSVQRGREILREIAEEEQNEAIDDNEDGSNDNNDDDDDESNDDDDDDDGVHLAAENDDN